MFKYQCFGLRNIFDFNISQTGADDFRVKHVVLGIQLRVFTMLSVSDPSIDGKTYKDPEQPPSCLCTPGHSHVYVILKLSGTQGCAYADCAFEKQGYDCCPIASSFSITTTVAGDDNDSLGDRYLTTTTTTINSNSKLIIFLTIDQMRIPNALVVTLIGSKPERNLKLKPQTGFLLRNLFQATIIRIYSKQYGSFIMVT